jgi:hypothetical protein
MSRSQRPFYTRLRSLGMSFVMLSAGMAGSAGSATASNLGFEERVACEQAIQEVYYSHRSWPQDSAKPPFQVAVSREQIEARVRASEDKARLLDERWGYRINAAQLQAEIERMATKSRRPDRLGELWAALGNDSLLVAECLVRPLLVERRIRAFFSADLELHGTLRRQAEAELKAVNGQWDLDGMSGQVAEFELRRSNAQSDDGVAEPSVRILDEAQFKSQALRLNLDHRIDSQPKAHFAELQEDDEAYWAEAVLNADADHIRLAVVHWPKRSFSEWFADARTALSAASPADPIKMANDTFSLPRLGTASCSDDTWSLIRPEGRKNHTAVWTGSEMIVWGGRSDIGMLRSGGRYDPATDSWTAVETDGSPPMRDAHTAVWTGDEMIVWGGNFVGFATATGYRYDPTTDSWTQLSTSGAPLARWGHTAVWAEDEGVMLIWGGITSCSGDNCNYTGTGGAYDPASDTWSSLPAGLSARSGHTATWTAAGMMVWGGRNASDYLGDGSVLQGSVGSWAWVDLPADNAPAPRAHHTAAWTGLQLIVWGGENESGPLADGARFIIFDWAPVTAVDAPPALVGHTATWVGSEMVVWGGENDDGVMNDTIYRYDPDGSGDSWSVAGGATEGRRDHTAIWTGSHLLVWGGEYGNEFNRRVLEHGRIYNPAQSNHSVRIVMAGHLRPAAREHHSAIWTGSEMIIWGGSLRPFRRTATGARYDPATAVWTPTERDGAAQERDRHTVVWTGSEMIVWGGSSPTSGGGRYNPTTDSWSGVSTTFAPSDRRGHSAVWTGSEMIVWGGLSRHPATTLGNGAAYLPDSDQWVSLPTSGAPTPRQQHSAVWTGIELIVWGGTGGTDTDAPPLGDGARYVPGNGWSEVASTAARKLHSATWTGSEMLVYGEGKAVTHYGERYHPGTNQWSPIIGSDSPPYTRNNRHRAVWSGTEWIIWGGHGNPLQPVRYEASSQTLRQGASTGSPPHVSNFSAVWVDGEMLVWGGHPTSVAPGVVPNTNGGGAYCAKTDRIFYHRFEN